MNTTTAARPLQVLNGAYLKYIALITMLIDHTGLVIVRHVLLFSQNSFLLEHQSFLWSFYHMLRGIGRISFPLFLFLLVQGFIHTRDRKAYALRLFLFAILSEIPFDLCVDESIISFSHQNVMWTLLLGFLMMWAMDLIFRQNLPEIGKFLLYAVVIAAFALLAWVCRTDYSYKGILALALLYIVRFSPPLTLVGTAVAFLWEPTALFSLIPLALYNGKKGHAPKYFFYLFYPVHLLLLYLLGEIIKIAL